MVCERPMKPQIVDVVEIDRWELFACVKGFAQMGLSSAQKYAHNRINTIRQFYCNSHRQIALIITDSKNDNRTAFRHK